MIISGLMDGATVTIMTLSGQVMRSISSVTGTAAGDQLAWDGRDENGKLVASGVYLVAVSSSQSQAVEFSKVAVIRH